MFGIQNWSKSLTSLKKFDTLSKKEGDCKIVYLNVSKSQIFPY